MNRLPVLGITICGHVYRSSHVLTNPLGLYPLVDKLWIVEE